MPSKPSSLLQGFLRSFVLLKHSQKRYFRNENKTEATGNTYIHTKINRNTHRHKETQTHTDTEI